RCACRDVAVCPRPRPCPPCPAALGAPPSTRAPPRCRCLTCAPTWPPIPPTARGSPGNPGRPSMPLSDMRPDMAPQTPQRSGQPGEPGPPLDLAAWLATRRWFATKTRRIVATAVDDRVRVGGATLCVVRVGLDDGSDDRYVV